MLRIRIWSDPDFLVGSRPFGQIQIRSKFPDPVPDPAIKSHITRNKCNKLSRYFCEIFTFKKIKPANSEKGGLGGRRCGRGGVGEVGVVGREVVVKAEK